MSSVVTQEAHKKDYLMYNEQTRLDTFKDWPFKSKCLCLPEKMAAAGFYHCPTDTEPDLVKCFVCCKELDGWEPSDDPWQEHRSHSKHCAYLDMAEKVAPADITVAQFMGLETKRQVSIMEKTTEMKMKEFRDYAASVRHEMERLVDK